jgi:energy-coupling factor transport system ATP-binding protein
MAANGVNPAVLVENLCYSWEQGKNTLQGISFSIADNECIVLAGRNGSGKSTLLKNITGLLRPSSGEIYVRGKNIRFLRVPQIAGEIAFVMQNPDRQLFADTVYDEVSYALKNLRLPAGEIRRRTGAALAALGLEALAGEFPPALARGDRAKTVIASALAMESKILILDESAASLDYRESLDMAELIRGLHEKGYTILLVTHNMSLAASCAKRIMVMHRGRIVLDGETREIFCRTGELAEAGILPPPAFRLSRELRKTLPLERDALSAGELGDLLLALKRGDS